MKKLLALILALCMILALAACGQQAASPAPAATEAPAAAPAGNDSAPTPVDSAPAPAASGLTDADITKDLTIIVPSGAGGATDIAIRAFVEFFKDHWPTNVNVINIGGAGGSAAYNELKNYDNDGYTITVAMASYPMNLAIGTFAGEYTWDTWEPICGLFSGYFSLCVRSDSPINTFEEFVNEVKTNPNFKYGLYSNSPATGIRLVLEDYTGVKFNAIDVAEDAKATELLAGRVDAVADFFSQQNIYVKSGDFRCLGIFVGDRLAEFPDIPTMKEQGVDYDITTQIMGLIAPQGTPQEMVDYICQKVQETYEQEEGLKPKYDELYYESLFMNSADYTEFVQGLIDNYDKFING